MRPNVTLSDIKRIHQAKIQDPRNTKRRGSEKLKGRTIRKPEAV